MSPFKNGIAVRERSLSGGGNPDRLTVQPPENKTSAFGPADTGLDSSLVMQTPEGIEYALFPAGLSARVSAWGIDFLISSAAILGLSMVTFVVMEVFGRWLFYIIYFAFNWFYHVMFDLIWNGQSPGKRIMGIRVVGSDGTPVSVGASFLRNLLRFGDGFFELYLIGFICMIASPGFRRIGDWAASTLVVYTSQSRLPRRFTTSLRNSESLSWLKDIPLASPGYRLDYEEKQGLLMFARRYPLLGKKRADEIARPWASRLRRSAPGEEAVSDSGYLLGIAHSINGVL